MTAASGAAEQVLYREQPIGPAQWRMFVLGVLMFVVIVWAVDGFGATGLIIGIGIGAAFAAIAAAALWSANRYHGLTLTRSSLRIGRSSYPVATIDPAGIEAVDPATPALGTRLGRGVYAWPTGRVIGRQDRVAGGAWGTPMSSDYVTLTIAGTRFLVVTVDRAKLLAALTTATRDSPD